MKIKQNIQFTLFFLALLINSSAQVTASDCNVAVNVCSNNSFSVSPAGSGSVIDFTTSTNISNPTNSPAGIIPPGGMGCLMTGELNPTWMIINVQTAGTLEFSLGAGTGAGAQSGCYDWILWPYTPASCSGINGNTLPPVRCCWNSNCNGGTGLASPGNIPSGGFANDFGAPVHVNCGDKFIICFSNYSSVTTLVPLNFFGSAVVSCSPGPGAPVLSVSGNTMICLGQTTTLTASGASTYTWSSGDSTAAVILSPGSTSSYTVTGGDSVCNSQAIVTISVSACTSVDEVKVPDHITVYPNPSNGIFIVRMMDAGTHFEIELIDSAGQEVWQQVIDRKETLIKPNTLAKGLYYYSVKDKERIVSFGKISIE